MIQKECMQGAKGLHFKLLNIPLLCNSMVEPLSLAHQVVSVEALQCLSHQFDFVMKSIGKIHWDWWGLLLLSPTRCLSIVSSLITCLQVGRTWRNQLVPWNITAIVGFWSAQIIPRTLWCICQKTSFLPRRLGLWAAHALSDFALNCRIIKRLIVAHDLSLRCFDRRLAWLSRSRWLDEHPILPPCFIRISSWTFRPWGVPLCYLLLGLLYQLWHRQLR